MAKLWIAFIIVVAVGFMGGMLYMMKKKADEAEKTSKQIIEDFKKVDKDLNTSNHSRMDSLQKVLDSLTANKNK